MRALRFHGPRDLRVDEIPPPPEPGPGEALIAPVLCGICGTDLHELLDGPRRTWPGPEPHPLTGAGQPQILGHELSAEVVAVGPGVRSVTPGDRVSVMPVVTCGRCHPCRAGEPILCELRAALGLRHPWGGFADLALVAEGQLARLPDAVTWEQGAIVEPAAVASKAVRLGGTGPGSSVLVVGAGPIGTLAALAALAEGAEVLVSEPNPRRRAILAGLGLEAVDPVGGDLVGTCLERTDGAGMDVAVDCAGSEAAVAGALASVRRGGTVVVAATHHHAPAVDLSDLMLNGKRLLGSVGYEPDAWPRVLAQIAAGMLPVERIAGPSVPLERAAVDGFERLLDPATDAIKVLVAVRAPQ